MSVFHRIDKILFWLLLLGGLFLSAMLLTGEDILLSAALACGVCLGLKSLFRALQARFKGRSRKARREYARAVLSQWLTLSDAEAENSLRTLLKPTLEPENARLILLPLSPTSNAFDADAVISAWKANREAPHLALAALCPASAQAKQWADKLDRPSVSLIDGDMLEKLFVEACPAVPESFHAARQQRRLPAGWFRRFLRQIHPIRAGLYALSALLLYLLSNSAVHLAAFSLFFALTLLSIGLRASKRV